MPFPDQIGRYRVERRLGAGAFGVVWLAHDDRLEAPVAIKVMAENWAFRMDIRERFLTEARLLRRATAGGVVQVFDIGELPDERPYFVMEYADRGTVEDRMAAGPVEVPEALDLTARAARGVSALYEAGIVHRDIKPSNILLAGGGTAGRERVLVADLGLAKTLAQASGLTVVAGSAGYMAPEQAEPFDGIDGRADVYSLGAVLYRLVTGAAPGSPGKVIEPDRVRPGLPPALNRAVLRAMEPDRERRWPTAAAFADELDRIAAALPVAAVRSPERKTQARETQSQETPARDTQARETPVPERQPSEERPAAARAAVPDSPPGRRTLGRRGKAVAAGAAAVVLLGAGTVVAVELQGRPTTPAEIRVTDATKRISFEMPSGWADEQVGSGWDPTVLGLRTHHQPGLTVAQDVSRWPDLTTAVSGVFVGIGASGGGLAHKAETIGHTGCTYHGGRAFTSDAWHGRVRTWSPCGTAGQSLEEIGLTATRSGGPEVYAQIRCDRDCTERTDGILRSLRVTGS
ncbi:serine/threonine-protein kinase [Streptomyces sp. NPDC051322]|uniref:serine/threonine-protein kinase n=1 Tax=Streptomyces sp. NPDC051322 TaxID=3154645 RepID=UPI0034508673